MKKMQWRLIPLILFVLLLFFLGRGLWLEPHKLPSTYIGKPLPNLQLPLLNAKDHMLAFNNLHGRWFLINVWASWCEMCTEEQVFLLQLAREGVSIYGINYKDKPVDAKRWLVTWGNPYQQVAVDRLGKAAIDLGVYGAPETFLVDALGIIRYRYPGPLTHDVWLREFLPRMHAS